MSHHVPPATHLTDDVLLVPLLMRSCFSKDVLPLNLPLLTLVLGIGGTFQYGLHISLINSPSRYVQKFINSTWENRYGVILHPDTITLLWSMIVSLYSIGGLLGSLIVGHLSVIFGRKKPQLYNNLIAILGAVLMCTSRSAQSFEMIMLGRFFYGINAGISLNLHTMYIGECAPQSKRGLVTVSVSFSIAFGKLMGFVIGLRELLGTEELWPYLLACSAVPALIQLVTLPFFPESPRYLFIDKGDKDGCLKAMQQLWGPGDHSTELQNMLAEKEVVGEQSKGLKDLLVDRTVRWQMISLMLICGAMQLIGINAVYFYAYDVFQNAGIAASQVPYMSLGIGIVEMFTTVLCGFLIDRLGRRTLLWVNYVILSLTLSLLTATLTFQDVYSWLPYASCMLIFVFTLSFGLGPGGISCVLPTELFVQCYRPAAYAISGAFIWLGLFVIGLAFPFIEEALGTFCFIFFLVYCISMAIYSFCILPETKDKSIMEILESFNKLNFGAIKDKEEDCEIFCPVQHWRILPLIIVLGLGNGLPLGYHVSVISSSSLFVKGFMNQTWIRRYGSAIPQETVTLLWSTAISVYSIGGLLGSLVSGCMSRRFGKRRCHIFTDLLGITASLCLGLSKIGGSFEMIIVGRFLYGFTLGLALNIYIQYLGEISPTKLRGFTNTTGPIFVTTGKLFGQIVGLSEVLGTETLWPLMLSLCGFTELLQLIVMNFYPETPPYLMLVKKDQERCIKAMHRIWGPGDHQAELNEILAEQEKRKKYKSISIIELVKEPSLRWQLYIVIVITFTLQMSGVNAIFYYANSVFLTAGLPPEKIPYISLGIGSFELTAVLLCSVMTERYGRKVILLGSYGLMATMLGGLTVTLSLQGWTYWIPYCSAVFIFLFIFFFGMGPGTLTIAIVIEICSHSSRAAVFVIIGSLNWIGLYVIGMVFPYVEAALGHYCFLIFFASIVASGIFLFFFLPETKGKTLQQITTEFNKLNFKNKKSHQPIEFSTCL
ncbi:uncharacterized protein [Dendropsophus ebraccatus]|uniref:uncharacterized protein n=1 Tax=Dendropsophus ebraccatus TaxID=150705 RepID=UPI0038310459